MSHVPDFSQLLTQYLAQRDRSPAWLARRLDVHPGTIGRWLNQSTRPATPELVIRVADVLGIHTASERQAILAAAGFAYQEGAAEYGSVAVNSEAEETTPSAQKSQMAKPVSQPAPAHAETVARHEEGVRHNLPVRLPALVGRDHDLLALQKLLQRSDINLVTLVGPGGVGKTQLSLKLASTLIDDFADGIFSVSLAPVRDAELVISALAQTWELQRQSNRPLLESVQIYLRSKRMLLILDNFEHLIAAAPLVSELLANCVHLRVIVTSREVLNIGGEHVYYVSPLSLPKRKQHLSVAAIAEAAAVQLFVQRAQAITPNFNLDETNAGDIAEICTYLDGLPLAVELVVARIRLLPPRTLRQRLLGAPTSSFEILQSGTRDAPSRHRTLKDAIAWSYDLLNVAEQRLFCLLSIFVGGCTLEAIEGVSEGVGGVGAGSMLDILASLVNKSLVNQVVQPDGEPRFLILEMIREYALEQLQANDDFAVACHAHVETFASFAEAAAPALAGPDHLAWIERLNADHDNLRAALQSAIRYQYADLAMRIGGALWRYWLEQGYYREGQQFLSAILQLAGATERTPKRANLLTGLGAMNSAQGNYAPARSYLEEAIAISREAGDERGLAQALEMLAEVAFYYEADVAQVHRCCTEAIALYEKVNDPVSAARMRQTFGFLNYIDGEYAAAQVIFEETLATFKAHHYEAGLGVALCNLGRALFQQQLFVEAGQRLTEALQRAQARGDQTTIVYALYFLGRIAHHHGEDVKAQPLFQESLRVAREIGMSAAMIAFPLAFLSEIALAHGDIATAREMLREGLTLTYQEQDAYAVSLILPRSAGIMISLGKYVRAVQLIAAGRSLYDSVMVHLPINDQVVFDAPLAAVRNLLPAQQFAEAWAAGERMTMEEAVALAMAETA